MPSIEAKIQRYINFNRSNPTKEEQERSKNALNVKSTFKKDYSKDSEEVDSIFKNSNHELKKEPLKEVDFNANEDELAKKKACWARAKKEMEPEYKSAKSGTERAKVKEKYMDKVDECGESAFGSKPIVNGWVKEFDKKS